MLAASVFFAAMPTAAVAKAQLVIGPGDGQPVVQLVGVPDLAPLAGPFGVRPGGMPVATGDLDGDGVADLVIGADLGNGPRVTVYRGPVPGEDAKALVPIADFFAYDQGFTGGVRVAVGDVDGDGRSDIVTGAGPGGGPHIKVFDAQTGDVKLDFFAFDAQFGGGVTVAAGDLNGDGVAEIIVGAGPGGGPIVSVFNGQTGTLQRSFGAFDANFTGGVNVAVGDIDGDGVDDIIVGAGPGGGPHVRVFNGMTDDVIADFFAFDPAFAGGVTVSGGFAEGLPYLAAGMASLGGELRLFGFGEEDMGTFPTADALLGTGFRSLFPFGGDYRGGIATAFLSDATGGGGAIPEPASWALMIGGFGLVGGALRYRRARVTA
jgi:hypothetical protein